MCKQKIKILKLLVSKFIMFKLTTSQILSGIFAIDEVKLSETLAFDRVNLKVEGFTDLGEYTPDNQKGQRGDQALVIMFQPFVGNFVQTIGCFPSKGSVKGKILHKIILEGVALAEQSGLYIDAVVTDGASWNRSMWTAFGISEKNISVYHPCNHNRRLWFFSDYPHLVKIFRNFITNFSKHDIIYVSSESRYLLSIVAVT